MNNIINSSNMKEQHQQQITAGSAAVPTTITSTSSPTNNSSNGNGNGNGNGKFTLYTAGLHNKILLDIDQQQQQNISPPKQISARSKLTTNPNPLNNNGTAGQNKQKPKRPSSANPRTRSTNQHREPGKPQKNHPILNNPNYNQPIVKKEAEYEGRNFAILNKEELLEALTEIKKQQRNNETIIAQLRADNQRLEGEVLKQQHRIDKLMSPQFSKNGHLLVEIRKEIEKSVLVRQLKAQMLSLRGTITEKEMIIESLQKKTNSAHLIELSAEKEEYYQEIQRLKKMVQQKEKELQQERSSQAWQKKGENVTLEDSLKAEISRLSRGYQQVLERLENTTAAAATIKQTSSRHEDSENHSIKSSSRPSSGKSKGGGGTSSRPKSAGAKSSTGGTGDRSKSNALDYIDPILTSFDPLPPASQSLISNKVTTTTTTGKKNSSEIPPATRKEPDFLYEMSEENVVGIGGESSVEAYLVTKTGLNISTTTPLPMGCKIQVQKSDEIYLEGRVCGFHDDKNTYDVQYEEGGREFDVPRSSFIVMGERDQKQQQQHQQQQIQQQQQLDLSKSQEPSPTKQRQASQLISTLSRSLSTRESVTVSVKSISANGLRHVEMFAGNNDPYVTLSFDTWKMNTSVQDEGGSDVTWHFHPSEGFQFDVTPEMIKRTPLKIEVYDKNSVTKDTLIGKGESSLQSVLHSPYGTDVRITIPLGNTQGRAAGTVIVMLVLSSRQAQTPGQGQVQGQTPGQGQGQTPGQGQGSNEIKRILSTSPRKEISQTNAFQVGDEIEGNFQRGGSWYLGVVLGVTGGKYRIRYQDGDEEANVLEENIRYPQQKKSSQTNQNHSPRLYLPNDRVEIQSSDGRVRIGTIQKVNMDGTYEVLYLDNSQYQKNLPGSSIIRGIQSESFPSQEKERENERERERERERDMEEEQNSPASNSDPIYAVGNRVEGNFRSRGKWYLGTIAGVKNHGESYQIDYDDGECEVGVLPKNIRLTEMNYNIDSILNGEDVDDENDPIAGAGLTTDDLLNDNYFQQLRNQTNQQQSQQSQQSQQQQDQYKKSPSEPLTSKQPSVDINTFLDGLSDDGDGDGNDMIGGNLDGGDSIHLDYGVCAPDEEDGFGDDGDDVLNQTNEYGEDFDD